FFIVIIIYHASILYRYPSCNFIFSVDLKLCNNASDLLMLRSRIVVLHGDLQLECRLGSQHRDDAGVGREVELDLKIQIARGERAVLGEVTAINAVPCAEGGDFGPAALARLPGLLVLEDAHVHLVVRVVGSVVEGDELEDEGLARVNRVQVLAVKVGDAHPCDIDRVASGRARVHVHCIRCVVRELTRAGRNHPFRGLDRDEHRRRHEGERRESDDVGKHYWSRESGL
ncbi:hypothetical protein PFISCL1PPCAC_3325, partial [Pristionchus fissidentatus]